MGEEEPTVAGDPAPVASPKTREQVKDELRTGPVRKAGGTVAGIIFDDPEFQKKMNNWMIGTHISWGIMLAFTFIAVNETLIWLQPPPWLIVVTFGPMGVGYLLWQRLKFRSKKNEKQANSF